MDSTVATLPARARSKTSAFFRVGQCQRVEDEQLVDLTAVEQQPGAFGRDLRVIGQDDRRGQQGTLVAFGADQDGPQAYVAALGSCGLMLSRWIRERDEGAVA